MKTLLIFVLMTGIVSAAELISFSKSTITEFSDMLVIYNKSDDDILIRQFDPQIKDVIQGKLIFIYNNNPHQVCCAGGPGEAYKASTFYPLSIAKYGKLTFKSFTVEQEYVDYGIDLETTVLIRAVQKKDTLQSQSLSFLVKSVSHYRIPDISIIKIKSPKAQKNDINKLFNIFGQKVLNEKRIAGSGVLRIHPAYFSGN